MKNSTISYETSKIVWIISRTTHPEHAQALAEAKRRCEKASTKQKNVNAMEAAIIACETGAPVPARKTTIRKNAQVPTPKRTRTRVVHAADVALAAGKASWEGDMLV